MSKNTKRPVPEQVAYRLALRSSSAASRHANRDAARKKPGHGNRRRERDRALADYR